MAERDLFHLAFPTYTKALGKDLPPVIPPPYSFMVYAEDWDDDVEPGPYTEDGPSGPVEENMEFPPIQEVVLIKAQNEALLPATNQTSTG